jgi:ABC-type polar amino acid transport system ATPase subunit
MKIVKETPIQETPRVMQVRGMFDLPTEKTSRVEWDVHIELPTEWNIGVIVGPSGSGKTTIASELFGDHLAHGFEWDAGKSIVDGFPKDCGIKDVTGLLSSVGFSSPPSWLRPFHVLSNGEQFRVTVARALAEQSELAVLDEFTSVVDRNVAQIGSAAVAKTVRKRNQKLIAVSCHYDILEWLEPDWVYEPATDTLTVGRLLQRPSIELEIFRVDKAAWQLFRKHHYLDTSLSSSAVCFLATLRGVPVTFSSWIIMPSGSVMDGWREHRTVTLPDFQGVGIGNAVSAYCASIMRGLGRRAFSSTSHPAMIAARARSPLWRVGRATSVSSRDRGGSVKSHSTRRLITRFEYVGPAMDAAEAARIYGA